LNIGCLNLQCVRKLSLRVYVARHKGHSNLPGKSYHFHFIFAWFNVCDFVWVDVWEDGKDDFLFRIFVICHFNFNFNLNSHKLTWRFTSYTPGWDVWCEHHVIVCIQIKIEIYLRTW
jgi:hypothetical protein